MKFDTQHSDTVDYEVHALFPTPSSYTT